MWQRIAEGGALRLLAGGIRKVMEGCGDGALTIVKRLIGECWNEAKVRFEEEVEQDVENLTPVFILLSATQQRWLIHADKSH